MTCSDLNDIRVMLVDDQHQRAVMVEETLKSCGFQVVSILTTASGLLFQIQQHKPHVVMIDIESPDRDILESLTIINQHNPTPVIMFSNEDNPDFIHQAIGAGVSAYMIEDINPAKVKPIIDVAIAQFEMFQALRRQLNDSQQQLADHQCIGRAKRLLMKHQKITEELAYKNMRTLAMNNGQAMADVARNVIAILDKDKPAVQKPEAQIQIEARINGFNQS